MKLENLKMFFVLIENKALLTEFQLSNKKLYFMGELLRTIQLNNYYSGMNTLEIDTKELNSGVYFVILQTGNRISKKMLIIQK